MERETALDETIIEPCPTCGWVKFNPDCQDCRDTRDECWVVNNGIVGFDM